MSAGEVIAVVHAKGTSLRVPGKNLRMLGDRPLFCHAIANARAARRVDRVVIDSEAEEILRIGCEWGAEALRRPASLASNLATGDDLALWQAQSFADSRIVVQVVPTSPFLSPTSIDRAVEMLLEDPLAHSVVGVFAEPLYLWSAGRPAYYHPDGTIPNSFEMEPFVYETTGLYANRTEAVLATGRRLSPDRCRLLRLSRIEAVDVNTVEDFEFAEAIWRGLRVASAAGRSVPAAASLALSPSRSAPAASDSSSPACGTAG
ncbi:MAG: cytidylyltransferase domain-containing protein [Candidatus Eisenbacteria bacterium]